LKNVAVAAPSTVLNVQKQLKNNLQGI